jgi:hypothetical protein
VGLGDYPMVLQIWRFLLHRLRLDLRAWIFVTGPALFVAGCKTPGRVCQVDDNQRN